MGLTVNHSRPHLTRAVLEGVAFGLRDSLELIQSVGLPRASQMRATGGGVNSRVWRQILADVLETTIVTMATSEGAAYGAALLAAVGSGWFTSVEEACHQFVKLHELTEPSPDPGTYRDHYDRYKGLYPALAPTFHSFA